MVLHRLDDMKAEDTLTINLKDKSSIGDYMVVSSGRSHRHVGSVADRVVEDLRKVGVRAQVEGMPHCDWVLIDAGDVIVHVFRPEVRDFYNLEKMWMAGRPRGAQAGSVALRGSHRVMLRLGRPLSSWPRNTWPQNAWPRNKQ